MAASSDCALFAGRRMRALVGDESKAQLSPEANFVTPLLKSAVQSCGSLAIAGASDGKYVSFPCVINALGNFDNIALQSASEPLTQCISLDGFVVDTECVLNKVKTLDGTGVQFTDRDVLTRTSDLTDQQKIWYGFQDVVPATTGPMHGSNQEYVQRGAFRVASHAAARRAMMA